MNNTNQEEGGVGQYFAIGGLIAVAAVVLSFLGLHSINFFMFTFPGTQEVFAWLGFGLTGGAFLVYVADLKWYARTKLQKTIAITMIFVTLAGELATAGFGMQLEAFKAAGLSFTKEDITWMIWAIRILGVLHGLALVLHFVGEEMIDAFRRTPKAAAQTAQTLVPASSTKVRANGHEEQSETLYPFPGDTHAQG